MPQHPTRFRGRHDPPQAPSAAGGGANENEILRQLIDQLAEPELTLPDVPERSVGSRFTQAVAAAGNPQFLSGLQARTAAEGQRPLEQAQFQALQGGKRTRAIQNLVSFLGLQESRRANRALKDREIKRKAEADRQRVLQGQRMDITANARIDEMKRQGQVIERIQSTNQEINLLKEQRKNEFKSLQQLFKRLKAENFLDFIPPDNIIAQQQMNDQEKVVKDIDLQIRLLQARLGVGPDPADEEGTGGQPAPPGAAPAAPGGPQTFREKLQLPPADR